MAASRPPSLSTSSSFLHREGVTSMHVALLSAHLPSIHTPQTAIPWPPLGLGSCTSGMVPPQGMDWG